jgi:hypothetical protein
VSTTNKAKTRTARRAWLSVALIAVLVWIGWKFRPWMPEGRAVHIGDAHFGNHDFEVWQRKNSFAYATEPFATALFVRKTGAPWKVYLLNIQDTYRPSVNLRYDNSGLAILYGKTKRGYFDEERDAFTLYHHDGGSNVIESIAVVSVPPGDWWQQLTSSQNSRNGSN